jgi:hypothetical protein
LLLFQKIVVQALALIERERHRQTTVDKTASKVAGVCNNFIDNSFYSQKKPINFS